MTSTSKAKGAALVNAKMARSAPGDGAASTEPGASRSSQAPHRNGTTGTKLMPAENGRPALKSGAEEAVDIGAAGAAAAAAVPAEELLSDEEVAWRLHQELNARSPMLRTRSRKPSDAEVGAAPSSSGDRQAAAAGRGNLSAAEPSPASSSEKRHENTVGKDGQQQTLPDADALPRKKPVKPQHGGKLGKGKPVAEAGVAAAAPAGKEDVGADPASQVAAAPSAAAAAVASAAVAAVIKAERIEQQAQQPPPGQADSKPAAGASQQGPGHAPAAPAASPKPAKGKQSAVAVVGSQLDEAVGKAEKPAGKSEKAAAKAGKLDRAAEKPGKAVGKPSTNGAAAATIGGPAGKATKPQKIPRLPMVRHARKWYRCRVLKDAGDKVLMEFSGMESEIPSAWIPRDSDRIWRGSYKGKDWKYLGDGAWAPKGKAALGNGSAAGKKGGRGGSRPRGSSASASVSREDGVGSSAVGSRQHEDGEEEEEMEEGDETAESQQPQPQAGAVDAAAAVAKDTQQGPAAGQKRSAAHAGLADSPAVTMSQAPTGSAAEGATLEGEAGTEAAAPAKKKGRARNGRKRLDPIVREALRAVEQAQAESEGEDEGEEAAAAKPPPAAEAKAEPAATAAPPAAGAGVAVTPERGPGTGPAKRQQDQEQAAAGQLQQPGNTPTPETPLTKLATRPSTTPGMQPMSPGAAVAAALASPLAGGTEALLPGSPRGGGGARRTAMSAAATQEQQPPLSPRGSKRGGMATAFDLPVSPRAGGQRGSSKARARGGSSEEDEEAEVGDAQPAKAARGGGGGRRRRRQAPSDSTTSDSEAEAGDEDHSSGAASDSAEDVVRQRPRRAAKKAALFTHADYAFDDEAPDQQLVLPPAPAGAAFVATSMEALAAFVQPPAAAGGGAAAAAGAVGAAAVAACPPVPARRRRKPVVSKAAPTDVAVPASEPAPEPVVHMDPNAYLAFLDQLPASPRAGAAPQRGAAAAQDSEDADEDYVPPASARDKDRDREHHSKEHGHSNRHGSHHGSGAHRGGGMNGRRRGMMGALGVSGGRVHKHEQQVAQHQRHYYHQHSDDDEMEDGLAELPQGLPKGGHGSSSLMGRSQSATANMQHPAGYHTSNGGSGDRHLNGSSAAHHRSLSSPARTTGASLGGLITATKLFGPILGALGGPAGAAHPATAAAAASSIAADANGSGVGSGGLHASPSKRHLFGAARSGGSTSTSFNPSSLNGFSSGTARPSLLALKDELFVGASFNASNGSHSSSVALPSSASSASTVLGGGAVRAPVPLFC